MEILIEVAGPRSNAWTPLLNAIISSAAVLFGIFMTNWFYEKHQRDERIVTFKRDKWQSTVERGEELYSAVAKWIAQTSADGIYARRTYLGEKTYDGWVKHRESLRSEDRSDSARIRMLVYVYFPSLDAAYIKMAKSVEMIESLQTRFQEYRDAGGLTQLGGFSKNLDQQVHELATCKDAFQKELAECMVSLTSIDEIAPGESLARA